MAIMPLEVAKLYIMRRNNDAYELMKGACITDTKGAMYDRAALPYRVYNLHNNRKVTLSLVPRQGFSVWEYWDQTTMQVPLRIESWEQGLADFLQRYW
jgi:hypothetical protein